ncbi:hypothetical protein DFR50_1411 [Roseiarcus fermentans]|uniref:Uncharacterized protein n=1 Tax=Roseiarcus fermentans TaxID=1473586 RepID=A0A366ER99_9HYPH|nr:hypothetical protein [Roseiarcus fermentans]RBP04029.1 hypothetical protein DFR50_1411 [Roseiarcus fermentans]
MAMSRTAAIVAALALASSAEAADLKIVDVKAYVFLERAGKLSDDILAGPALVDAPKGGAPGGDTATGVLLDFTFSGDRNFAPKYATATVDLTQTGHGGQQIVTHKAFTGFRFGDDGVEHKAIYLENATCAPLAVAIHAGKTEKQVQLDFSCTEVRASN